MGSARSRVKSHSKLAQTMRSSSGLSALGSSVNDVASKGVPHHGQVSSGIGEGLLRGSFWYWRTRVRASPLPLKPFEPMTFGVAALPTQRPISKGHVPYRAGFFSRSSSRAHTSPAARPSWSSVSSRKV